MTEETFEKKPFQILIPQPISKAGVEFLKEKGYEIKFGSGTSIDRLKADIADCDAALARTEPYPAEVLLAAPRLKVIARHGVGVDNIDLEKATELGIQVTNAPESNATSVAEHTMLLILGTLRYTILCNKEFRNGNFGIRDSVYGYDATGKILGIVGIGRIGARVAKKAVLGFSMRVIGYDPFLASNRVPPEVDRMVTWEELFTTADIVTLHLPSSQTTKNLIGRKEFLMMKKTAFLINAARGEIVDEEALITALQEKEIAGAGLDVFKKEPPEKNHPLYSFDNIFLTPHNATLTQECMERMALHAAQGIDEVLTGKTPAWPVNNLE